MNLEAEGYCLTCKRAYNINIYYGFFFEKPSLQSVLIN